MGTFSCNVWKTVRRLWLHFNIISITFGNGLKTDSGMRCGLEKTVLETPPYTFIPQVCKGMSLYPKLGVNRDGTLFLEEH